MALSRPSLNPPIAWVEWACGRSTKPDFFNNAMGVAFMTCSTHATEWKPEASGGNRTQSEMPFIAKVATLHQLDLTVLLKSSFSGTLVAAAQYSGREDWQIADLIHISHGYMSKFIRSVGESWAKRLVKYMNVTQSLAPLQWIANEMGCDIVVRHRVSAEVAALRSRLAEIERHGYAA